MQKNLAVLFILAGLISLPAHAIPECGAIVSQLNQQTGNVLDGEELVSVLESLNQTGNLPNKFVTKKQAQQAGWQPGNSLWSAPTLKGKSIGGDRFGNYEKQLPRGQWKEADLNYKGGKRGAYRIVFSRDAQRFITVDHYKRFIEVTPCQ